MPGVSKEPQGEPDDEHSGIQFDEELEEQWLEEWEEAERDAVELLRRALHDHSGQPAPSDEPARVAATVRARLRAGNHPFAWIRRAAGLNHEAPPDDDTELLVRCAAATISPREETGLDVEDERFLLSLEHADWPG